jgi:hypothetical protein
MNLKIVHGIIFLTLQTGNKRSRMAQRAGEGESPAPVKAAFAALEMRAESHHGQ